MINEAVPFQLFWLLGSLYKIPIDMFCPIYSIGLSFFFAALALNNENYLLRAYQELF